MTENLTAKIEALLFVYGDPISIKKIASVLSISEEKAAGGLADLKNKLESENRGVVVIGEGNTVQLATRPEFSRFLEDIIKNEFTDNLTPAALETLAIISYVSPVTRAEIDYIRGVNSSFILRSLTLRGLVERFIKAGKGNAYVYKPSLDLLKKLGISGTQDLPEFEKFKSLASNFYENQLKITEEIGLTNEATKDEHQ